MYFGQIQHLKKLLDTVWLYTILAAGLTLPTEVKFAIFELVLWAVLSAIFPIKVQ